jgi:hypothetical protein
MARVILSRGHVGTGGRPGASFAGFDEVVGSRKYMAALEDTLRAAGHEVITMAGFPYRTRHRRAVDLRADVYLACHCNATGTDRDLNTEPAEALFGYDHRSRKGARLAALVADEVEDVKGVDSRVFKSSPEDWTAGMYSVISGVYDGRPVALCLEPLYVDRVADEVWRTDEGLADIGCAIGRGVVRYLKETQ